MARNQHAAVTVQRSFACLLLRNSIVLSLFKIKNMFSYKNFTCCSYEKRFSSFPQKHLLK